jgi:uncharacterized membrane protein YGL010W
LISFSLVGFLSLIPLGGWFDGGMLFLLLVLGFYSKLSPRLAFGMLIVAALIEIGLLLLVNSSLPSAPTLAALFGGAWVAQFIGHALEGEKPSFLQDVVFLLIGPLWLLAHVYEGLGIRYE